MRFSAPVCCRTLALQARRHSLSQRKRYSHAEHRSSKSGALDGIRVLDLSRILAGPFCSQILADYGADVIKIEQRVSGDETRSWQGSGEAAHWADSAGPISFYFAAVNRNKRSVTLDLKQHEALEIVYELAKTSDVVLENFLPGAADRLGVGYEKLSSLNPRLVYASISGYGSSGPYAQRPGYDAIAAAEGGLMHITGSPDGGPVRPGLGMTDMATGLYTHGAIMAALYSRERTGESQRISASLFETQISLLINVGADWLNRGVDGKRYGAAHPSIVPYNTWECSDGQWLTVAANNDRQFHILCERVGRPELIKDERFKTNAKRVEHRSLMDEVFEEAFRSKSCEGWLRMLEGSGLAHGPVNTIQNAFEHPQTQARGMVRPVDWDAVRSGDWQSIGPAVEFEKTKATIKSTPPTLGEHTNVVLREVGYANEKIEDLRRRCIV